MEYYIGEIRMFAGEYAPEYWHLCDGRLLDISKYPELFSLLGVTYGGDGTTTFALPDLRGRLPIHLSDKNYALGSQGGTETVTLTKEMLPKHTHRVNAVKTVGNAQLPANALWASAPNYSDTTDAKGAIYKTVSMHTESVSAEGGNQEHENMMPSFAVSFIIALKDGLLP